MFVLPARKTKVSDVAKVVPEMVILPARKQKFRMSRTLSRKWSSCRFRNKLSGCHESRPEKVRPAGSENKSVSDVTQVAPEMLVLPARKTQVPDVTKIVPEMIVLPARKIKVSDVTKVAPNMLVLPARETIFSDV